LLVGEEELRAAAGARAGVCGRERQQAQARANGGVGVGGDEG